MAAQDPTVSTESNALALVVTSWLMLALTWFSVLLRSYVRAFMTNGFLADDWFMLAAQANFTVSCAFILRGCRYGLGRHNKSLEVYDEINALEWQALATATYVLNMWLIKMSIGIFLLRLATQRRYQYTLYASIGIVTVWSLVLFFWNIFQCNPVEAQWDYTILSNNPDAHCVSADEVVSAAYALSVMTILSDWLFALIPIPMVWNVKMTIQAKITVIAVLSVGIFASIATLVRLKFLSDLTDTADILFAGTNAMTWTLIEPGLAIFASSLVTIRPLLRYWGINGFQSTERSRSGFRSGKQQSRTNATAGTNRMRGGGSVDATLVDIETGHNRSDNGKSGGGYATPRATTWGDIISDKNHTSRGTAMQAVGETAEERYASERITAASAMAATVSKRTNTIKKKPSPVRIQPSFQRIEILRHPSSSGRNIINNKDTSNIHDHNSSSHTPTRNRFDEDSRDVDVIIWSASTMLGSGGAPQDNNNNNNSSSLSPYSHDRTPLTPDSLQGRTWLASDQGSVSSSTFELTIMEPPNDQPDIAHGLGTSHRRR